MIDWLIIINRLKVVLIEIIFFCKLQGRINVSFYIYTVVVTFDDDPGEMIVVR